MSPDTHPMRPMGSLGTYCLKVDNILDRNVPICMGRPVLCTLSWGVVNRSHASHHWPSAASKVCSCIRGSWLSYHLGSAGPKHNLAVEVCLHARELTEEDKIMLARYEPWSVLA